MPGFLKKLIVGEGEKRREGGVSLLSEWRRKIALTKYFLNRCFHIYLLRSLVFFFTLGRFRRFQSQDLALSISHQTERERERSTGQGLRVRARKKELMMVS